MSHSKQLHSSPLFVTVLYCCSSHVVSFFKFPITKLSFRIISRLREISTLLDTFVRLDNKESLFVPAPNHSSKSIKCTCCACVECRCAALDPMANDMPTGHSLDASFDMSDLVMKASDKPGEDASFMSILGAVVHWVG